jgi:GTP-binding protein EngB required for normal cell division
MREGARQEHAGDQYRPPVSTSLNESQQRRLIATCRYIDGLLADLERALNEAQSNSPFGRYANDLAPAEQRLVGDYIARVRTQMVRMLNGQGLSPTPRPITLRYSLLTHLTFADISIEELKPHYMEDYGRVAPEAYTALNGIVEELQDTIRQLKRHLSVDSEDALLARVQQVASDGEFHVLRSLEQVIAKYGLVQFRSFLGTIVDTLARRDLELAVFGRVSTGKSSLLNHLLGRDVLPVGVTPITAVPTRITYGASERLLVRFADAAPRELGVGALPEYASEKCNPANVKRVVRLIVELPAPFLQGGVTLVDTPGLGSLATSGAAETLAYLPRCDVAAVLIDASATMAADDLTTIAALVTAGVRVSVLLSKADLLSEEDLDTTIAYVRDVLAREHRIEIPVAAISVKPTQRALFDHWAQAELVPMMADRDRARRTIAARKTEILRAQVIVALQHLPEGELRQEGGARTSTREADRVLQSAAGDITALDRGIERFVLALPQRSRDVIQRAAALIEGKTPPASALREAFLHVTADAGHELARRLENLSASLVAARNSVTPDQRQPSEDDAAAPPVAGEIPIPALPSDLTVPDEGVERLLGSGLARAIVARRLERALGKTVRETLENYSSVLRRWALERLDHIREDWAASTDALRADLDRGIVGQDVGNAINAQEVEADLRRLGAVPLAVGGGGA